MGLLIFGAALFLFIHLLISGTAVRGKLIARFGAKSYLRGFSIASAVGLGLMIYGYSLAPYFELWTSGVGARHATAAVMLLASLLFVGAFVERNPTVVGLGGALKGEAPAKGMLRVTRHPFLWAVVLWSIMHLFANGDLASVVLFGSLLILALIGPYLIDARHAAEYGADWDRYVTVTSNLPFGAILGGRNKFVWAEFGWKTPVFGVVLYVALFFLHPYVIGVTPLP